MEQGDPFTSAALEQLQKPRKESRKGTGRACLRCRQLRRKCDNERPCQRCQKHGEECRVEHGIMSCIPCRTARIKCDKQFPCSSCVKRGMPEGCVSQVQNGVSLFKPREEEPVARGVRKPAPSVHDTRLWFSSGQAPDESPAARQSFQSEGDFWDEQLGVHVARPIVQQPKRIRLTDDSPSRALVSALLRNQIIQRAWEAGYSRTELEQLFGSLPLGLHEALLDGLRALETLAWAKAQAAQLAQAACSGSSGARATAAVTPDTIPQSPRRGPGAPLERAVTDAYEELGCGWWCLTFDTVTGRRSSLEINRTLAEMISVHPEELLSRAGNSDVPLPHSQLEFFCCLLDDLFAGIAGQHRIVRYVTLTTHVDGKVEDTFLVRRESVREFSPDGKVARMQHFIFRISEQEFDAARLTNPALCRPYLSFAVFDPRSGPEFLASAHRDYLFDEQFGVMQQTAAGRSKLQALEASVRERFRPLLHAAAAAKRRVDTAVGEAAAKAVLEREQREREYVYLRVPEAQDSGHTA